jgi:hypothetical protein
MPVDDKAYVVLNNKRCEQNLELYTTEHHNRLHSELNFKPVAK